HLRAHRRHALVRPRDAVQAPERGGFAQRLSIRQAPPAPPLLQELRDPFLREGEKRGRHRHPRGERALPRGRRSLVAAAGALRRQESLRAAMRPSRRVRSLVLLLAVLACTAVPVTGRKELNLVGEGTMNQLGAQTYGQEISKGKKSTDADATAMVQRVAKRIADAAEANFHPNYQWEATLLDDPKTVNAWCLPGGKIAVYSGILPLTRDETGLAVVLGHETAHALAHHGAERVSRSTLMQLGESGILAAVGAAKPEAVKATAAALGLGSQVGVELPFSRSQESEADHIGLVR